MPALFYGTLKPNKKPRLYGEALQPFTTDAFKHFTKFGKLTPKKELRHVARLWHLPNHGHSALSWIDSNGEEQTVFLPKLLTAIDAIATARALFPTLIPSPITFRVGNSIWELK